MDKDFALQVSKNVVFLAAKKGLTILSLEKSLSSFAKRWRAVAIMEGRIAPSVYEAYCLARILKVSMDSLVG